MRPKKADIILCLSVVALLGLTVAMLYSTGLKSRVYLDHKNHYVVNDLSEAVAHWEALDLQGRVLYVFDDHVPEHFAEAHRKNIVREVRIVIHDSAWPQVRETLKAREQCYPSKECYRMTADGTPVVVMPLSEMKNSQEPVLLYVADQWGNNDRIGEVAGLLREGRLEADITLYQDWDI